MPNQYNDAVLEIWKTHAEINRSLPGIALFPMQRADLKINPDLLFIGMNPSFSKGLQKSDAAPHYRWDSSMHQDKIDRLINFEREAQQNYKIFFEPLRLFSLSVRADVFENLDLLPVRHTSQSEVISSYWNKKEEAIEITKLFLELFKTTLLRINPRSIIVANAGVSKKLIEILDLKSSDENRSYRWQLMKEVPFFLSGMLSGQRAIDKFSRDRLAADVRQFLNN
ncbi:MAG: hypothetical protein EOP04_18885 [Proteobacteria bacterium]|nr:MAG: hypothetical protein EOP04_18885 [Pseudomonadota bacterium]